MQTETNRSRLEHSLVLLDVSFTFRVRACDSIGLEFLGTPGWFDVNTVFFSDYLH